MNPIRLIKHHLYLFQLENYRLGRYLRLSLRTFLHGIAGNQRRELKWTPKAVAIFSIAVFLQLFFALISMRSFALWPFGIIGGIFLLYALSFIFFVFLIASSILIYPIDYLAKAWIVGRAKNKFSKFPNLKIIGVAGSYGKTTMKEALKQVLSIKYKVLSTPESVNTPVGIGRLILSENLQNYDIFIVEMGAYERGDIKGLCEITRPDIGVLTGINEAHLERFGNLGNTIAAKFEIVENAKPQTTVVLNEDNKLIKQNYQKYLGDRKVKFYSANAPEQYRTELLGEYARGVISGAVIIAKELGLSDGEIRKGVSQIRPVTHRLQPIFNEVSNILVIDDSYSGNPDGAREAIKVLSQFKDRRKIYITPGLVEMGDKAQEIHLEIGGQLASVADIVILVKNSVTPYVAEGLKKAGYKSNQIIWFANTQEAHKALPLLLRSGDVILFQNDWPENYL